MSELWNKNKERYFFIKSLEFATPEQLFYVAGDGKFYAYWPKNYKGTKTTLQSRNSLIGAYTEKWCTDLFNEIAETIGGYSVQGVICEEIGLIRESSADVAICKTKVWNWQFIPKTKTDFDLACIGDYKTHQGNPGLLRSDTILKAIGKGINIRVSSPAASKIPIVVIGNTPISKNYCQKVDHLKRNGIIQGFWSVNPAPLDNDGENIKSTPFKGFYRFDKYEELKQNSLKLLGEDREFFSSMQSKKRLGEIIEIANRELAYELKAQRFLELLQQTNE